ncbi:SWIRM-domain-containing protein [Coprinopsis marcescibilis]|uniref:Transcriptional adapter 2 n=1 Tax=Coprinopsis marcescibilis TaxID=230819 RepID=A0A5C3KH63_COPMA|nr:SWIRM-domain-containing protein [Coprinopsis marcescibilis]
MTIDGNKKPQRIPEEVQIFNDPDTNYNCDSCNRDLTHTVRIKCADRACQSEEGVDVCPGCFCAGKEFKDHKRWHAYRVIGMNARPIFTEDWGADEELLLITGIKIFGIGNWKRIAEHIGTRTKDEVASHYKEVYVDSPDWPKPKMDRHFDVEPEEFQRRKRRRITEINKLDPPPPGPAPTSLPGIHEVATFLPGRLEFEHEIDNDAEDLVKDLEFGVVYQYGGDAMPEDELDPDVRARKKWEEEKRAGLHDFQHESSATPVPGFGSNGSLNGHHTNGVVVKKEVSTEDVVMVNGTAEDENAEEPIYPPPIETQESLDFKLTLLDMYFQKVAKRLEAKGFMYDRGLLEYKKMQAAERKRPKEEREFINRLRPFARLQTSSDYEAFTTDMLYETILRKRIQELQQYRRLGLCSAADIEKYDRDLEKRKQTAKVARDYGADRRQAGSREPTPRPGGVVSANGQPARRPPAPLNLSNSPSVHLLTPAEQALCSSLRILPKPYLIIKETLVREYARRGGKLRRREARDLVKIDVNKTSRVWDFLVQAGYLKIATEINPVTTSATTSGAGNLLGDLKYDL